MSDRTGPPSPDFEAAAAATLSTRWRMRERINTGFAAYRAGRLDRARAVFEQILDDRPNHAGALHGLGLVLRSEGCDADSLACLQRAVAADPGNSALQFDIGSLYQAQNRLVEARGAFAAAVAERPQWTDAIHQLCRTLIELGHVHEARGYIRHGLAGVTIEVEHNQIYAELAEAAEAPALALQALTKILRVQPDDISALRRLGACHARLGARPEAEAAFRRVLTLAPDDVSTLVALAAVLLEDDRLPECHDCLEHALAWAPLDSAAHLLFAALLQRLGELDRALVHAGTASEIEPSSAEAKARHALILRDLGRIDEALADLDSALEAEPTCGTLRLARASCRLLRGEFEAGWEDWEGRLDDSARVRSFVEGPIWDGGPLDGRTLLVETEGNVVETILFSRYLAPLVSRLGVPEAGRILLRAPGPLVGLLGTASQTIEIVEDAGPPPDDYDVRFALGSLPRLFGTRLDSIPAPNAYLAGAPGRIETPRHPAGEARLLRIGVRADPEIGRIGGLAGVGLSTSALTGVLSRPDLDIVLLNRPILGLGADLPALVSAMMARDLVVTVDGPLAHLAAAIGRPTWILVTCVPDWPWLLDRPDSPWYASVRLFRQVRRGSWAEPLEALRDALDAFANAQVT